MWPLLFTSFYILSPLSAYELNLSSVTSRNKATSAFGRCCPPPLREPEGYGVNDSKTFELFSSQEFLNSLLIPMIQSLKVLNHIKYYLLFLLLDLLPLNHPLAANLHIP